MNLNHDPDKHLLEQIDKRLTGKQPIGDTVIDELAATRPVPREAFQETLEARLLARVETAAQGETIMAANSVYLPVRSARRSWLPLTLLAAMLVVIVTAAIFATSNKPLPSEISLAQQNASATATSTPIVVTVVPPTTSSLPIDRTTIEVPLTLLSADSIVANVGDSVDILALLPFNGSPTNVNGIPATTMPDGTRLIEKFVVFGAAVLGDAEQVQTMVFSVPPDEGRLLAWLVEQGITLRLQAPLNSILPNLGDSRVVSIPVENVTAVGHIQVGDAVAVYSTCAFAADGTIDCNQPTNVAQTTATVIIGEIPAQDQQLSVSYDSIGVAVSPDVFSHLDALNNLGMHFKLVKAVHSEPAATPAPTGSRIVNIPLNSVSNMSMEVTRGDSVDVIATCALVPETTDANNAVIPAKADCTQAAETQMVRSGLVLLPYVNPSDPNTPVVSVAVSWDEEAGLLRMIDAGMRFNIVRVDNPYVPTATAGGVPLTEASVDIPWTTIDTVEYGLREGDQVNVYATCVLVDDPSAMSNALFHSIADCTQPIENMETVGTVVKIDGTTLVLAAPYYAQARLSNLIMAGMHFKLVKAGEADNRLLVPDGKVAIAIPMTSLKMLEGESLAAGDTVDVITSYTMVDIGSAPSEFQQVITPESEADVTAKEWTSIGAKGAQILIMNEIIQPQGIAVASLAVTPQEAVVLTWVLELGNPITLRKSAGNAAPASPYTLQLPLDALAHWTTDAVAVGDQVDLVMGFVLGEGEQVTMNFQPYATYTWGDALSRGEVSAQVYAPVNDTPFGPAFLRRVIHGAVITSMRVSKDATTGRLSDVLVILELPSGTSSRSVDEVKGFIEAGMPYLLLKP